MSYENYQPRNILITGGAGFIGGHFIRYLLENKNSNELCVINLDALTYAANLLPLKAYQEDKRYHFIQGNICDLSLIENILAEFEIDSVVHFAAESHVDRSITNAASFIQSNVMGTFNLLEATKKYWLENRKWNAAQCRFHHISTDEVYGALSEGEDAFHETSRYAPNSPYSASKASSDHLVRAYYHTYNLPITMSHCSNNYGPYQHAEKFIPTIIRHCLEKKPIPIYGNGLNIRDWLYVKDHCEGVEKILRQAKVGEVYNLGGQFEISNIALAQKICSIFDDAYPQKIPYAELIQFVNDRPGHDFRYAMNFKKIKNDLGWQPKTSFEEGILKSINFYAHPKEKVPVNP